MNLFLLSAGRGSRLMPLTENYPKPLIDLGDGTCLLQRQIEGAIAGGKFNSITVCAGYLVEKVEAFCEAYRDQIEINVTFNPFYRTTNNIISLWCAEHILKADDFVISNGDNLYSRTVWDNVWAQGEGLSLCVGYKDAYDEDDM